jgi:Gas vesicle synthesis protein GvpL/GvpF
VYTYAFALPDRFDMPEGMTEPVKAIGNERLVAIVEPGLSFEALQANDQLLIRAALTHDRVICDLFRQITVLPLRFGTRFLSEEKLRIHLEENADQYVARLETLVGKAEYTLKFMPHPLIASPESEEDEENKQKGKQYFLAKKQQYQARAEQQELQQAQWQAIIERASAIYPVIAGQPQEGIEKIYLLAEREGDLALQPLVQQWQAACSQGTLKLEGALPPYHFA